MVDNIPSNWVVVKVSDIGDAITGNTPPKKNVENYGIYIPFVKPPELLNGSIVSAKDYLSEEGSKVARVLPTNSILVSCIGNLGKTGINKVPVAFNQQINAIVPYEGITPTYIFYQTQSHDFRNQLESKATATTISIINKGNFETTCLNIAPINEQKRIVAKIEELFTELEAGVASLQLAQAQLKTYRQALLKHAFEGKLTAQWRADNPDKLEDAQTLLQRIKAERQARYEAELAAWEKGGKENGRKPHLPQDLSPLTPAELNELPQLPDGWGWVRLAHIQNYNKHAVKAGPFGSSLKKEYYVSNGYKIYGQEQVINRNPEYGGYYVDEQKYQELISCEVKPFDILISLVGTIGKVLVLPEIIQPGIINPRLVKITLNLNFYNPVFFKNYFESGFLSSLYSEESQGTTMAILNLGIIQKLPYPLCSIEEQNKILQELESRLSVVDQLEQTITITLQQAEALRQSILKKAFAGQLVPQDPADEPASVLLARIQATKEAAGKTDQAQKNANKKPTRRKAKRNGA